MRQPPPASPSPARGVSRIVRYAIVILLVAGAVWLDARNRRAGPQIPRQEEPDFVPVVSVETGGEAKAIPAEEPRPPAKSEAPVAKALPKPPEVAARPARANGYERLDGCRVEEHRNNDGDSFMVRHGQRVFELRLYYVDTAEKYLSDRYADQRERVAKQARDFGGITVEQTVALGQQAKAHTMSLLEGRAFTVYTKWERVYDGERYYGFVVLPGREDYLCEELVSQGLVRIHTKGEPSPDGLSVRQFEANLRALEKEAKTKRRGAWGLKPH